jgi:hypothetical protein
MVAIHVFCYRDFRAQITPSAAKRAEFWSSRTVRRARLYLEHGVQRDKPLYLAYRRGRMLTAP